MVAEMTTVTTTTTMRSLNYNDDNINEGRTPSLSWSFFNLNVDCNNENQHRSRNQPPSPIPYHGLEKRRRVATIGPPNPYVDNKTHAPPHPYALVDPVAPISRTLAVARFGSGYVYKLFGINTKESTIDGHFLYRLLCPIFFLNW